MPICIEIMFKSTIFLIAQYDNYLVPIKTRAESKIYNKNIA